ncbi:hypothetical protein ASPWEDRAFT_182747 [Aspergillus wentii DTO 134E9]|uniref:Aromatic amino acid beta-eliminating lyase/threonine aldolase domain-containing protein n=1 Tax=Aspergillus wentii DTO 134E9 TaxID=1073089 RepID=A0A1L9RSK0_ASPWE|nr:uncharacterized protein ASPWEDRAFT_182747 [Aspergillus wentii DTO 134E9]OJJ37956.1 hypothetical protein ASPWEDRAFT_182747 [Aspergillus wentii DTO 134E9]
MSSMMGNYVAIRTHFNQPLYAVPCDHRSDILTSESAGVSAWTGATVVGVMSRNGRSLTVEDIQEHAVLRDNIDHCPMRLISLEKNTLHGLVMSLDETSRIINWAHNHDICVHFDGARLWHAVVAGAGSLSE